MRPIPWRKINSVQAPNKFLNRECMEDQKKTCSRESTMCFVLFNNSWFCESIRYQNLNFAFLSCHWGHQIRLLLKTELLFLCGRLSYVYFKLFVRQRKYLIFPRSVIIKIINLKIQWYYTLNVRSRGKQLVLFSRES